MKRLRFKLSPELGDGCSSSIVDEPYLVAEAVKAWAEETREHHAVEGEGCEITTVLMSDEEVAALPEV